MNDQTPSAAMRMATAGAPPTSPGPLPLARSRWPIILCTLTHLYLVVQVLATLGFAFSLTATTYSSTTSATLNSDGTTTFEIAQGTASTGRGWDSFSMVLVGIGGILSLLAMTMIVGLMGRRRWVIPLARVWLVLGVVMLVTILAASFMADSAAAGGEVRTSAGAGSGAASIWPMLTLSIMLVLGLGFLSAWLMAIPGAVLLLRRHDRRKGRPPALV